MLARVRILTVGNMYPPHHLGGYELMWRSAIGHLREWGHEVRVLTTDYRTPEPDPATPEDEGVFRELRWYWHDHEFPALGVRARVTLERHNAATLARHTEDFRPEGVSWWAMGGMSLSLLEQGRRAGLPASCVVVDDWLLYGPEVDAWSRLTRRAGPLAPALERMARVPARMNLEHAAAWLFASETLRRRAGQAGFSPADSVVAYPGIEHGLFAGPRQSRADWTWHLLYCGRIDERKGVDTSIEALAALPEQATLTVVGGGDEDHLRELRALAAQLGVEGRVTFERRPRSELPATYAAADVTLFPVRWEEPFGLVPLESMAMGTPVIASGRGGSSEYLSDGRNCLLFDDSAGAPALAGAIERVAADAELRERLHGGGLDTASRFRTEAFDRAVLTSLESRITS